MAAFVGRELEQLGVKVRIVDLGKQVLDGHEIRLPPAILGSIGDDPKKKTIQLYAHYDVQPVSIHFRLSCPCQGFAGTRRCSPSVAEPEGLQFRVPKVTVG